ncbi:Kip2p KNAG_0J01720 [Huiozyma naganishii CBS 8797]|uniref:Kinesin motor domain-containing protein n=1 Tax=Huiozyma naganishii (strain ATCC MYA-139 / BCRC 22969 / CBS 8797 / KCTC 17520 / NBRC 10181 / NCYC 3082 / Yp74L-3) TaxID=1071383 RepID=J7RQZ5_HUIN7|nr:hypothetical protein KNAG_0J01720 [Kazachstania naganishii CBS 8797]CCK72253.1 hypothetical protein KNAG_0J01720 [Kazachstania naganishii CBS 8797]
MMMPPKSTPSPHVRRQSAKGTLISTPKSKSAPLSPLLSSRSSLRRTPSQERSRAPSTVSSGSSNNSSTQFSISKRRAFLSSPAATATRTNRATITVAVRIKPTAPNVDPQWHALGPRCIAHWDQGDFQFDHVFGPTATNEDLFAELGGGLVEKLFDGCNATLLAYGTTGSGKTYTMVGHNDGIVKMCGDCVFTRMLNAADERQVKRSVTVSYLEIYNEKICDLLNSNCRNEELKVRDDPVLGVKVHGVLEQKCDTAEELMKWVSVGEAVRKTGKTDYNMRSSRSHAIIQVKLITTNLLNGTTHFNTLSLCDLAGSEKASEQLERRKEGSFINKSLLALGTVISKLSAESNAHDSSRPSSGSLNNSHIPYRDSKLTRLLQPALCNDSVVTAICTIDPTKEAMTETVNTLRFASRAKNVSLNVSRKSISYRPDSQDAEKDKRVRSLTKLVEEQDLIISNLKKQQQHAGSALQRPNSRTALLEAENRVLRDKLQHCERLLDNDSVELQDSQIMEIVDFLPPEVGVLLETKFQSLESENRQYRNYTKQLEAKIASGGDNSDTPAALTLQTNLAERESKIHELLQMLDRKDKMIDALQSSKRLRNRALRPIADNSIGTETTTVPIKKQLL